MNTYRAKMRTRANWVSLAAVVMAIIFFVLTFYRDQLPTLPSFIKGFHQGAFLSFELLAVWFLSTYMRIRNKDEKLKQWHIAETDERTGLIIRNASTLAMAIIFSGLGMATIVAGFFSTTVFFSLMGALLFILVVFYVLWIYYAKKL
ncbi:hypothetical protein [Paenibacillus daejeonensis]|uniref:hypothetical protein n=1 Tax=Paenibacillus daejeonensis TaxID=135193 RepID=UPI0003710701|nr:hypothetical protein [Paenibacillus daejeonensis]